VPACITHPNGDKLLQASVTKPWFEKLSGRDNFEDLSLDESIILKGKKVKVKLSPCLTN
jgi:hypothetical protein